MISNEEKLAEAILECDLDYVDGCREDHYFCCFCEAELHTRLSYKKALLDFKHKENCAVLLAIKILEKE